jgi:Spy/CpxP family protein refolding chaperone
MKKVVAFFIAVVAVAGVSAFVTLQVCEPKLRGEHAAAHAWLHHELKLTSEQERALDPIEAKFAEEHQRLEAAIVEAKRALAQAMAEDKAYSPRVVTAVESVHQRMGDMRRASIRHVFDMRTVLSPEQAEKLLTLAQRALEQSH